MYASVDRIAVIADKLEGDYLNEQAKPYKLRRSVGFRIEPVLIEYGQDKSGFLLAPGPRQSN